MYVPGGKEVTGTGDYITSTDLWRPVGGWVVAGGGVVWSGRSSVGSLFPSSAIVLSSLRYAMTHDLKKN